MSDSIVTLDVRPILRDGGEPFAEIMNAVARLTSGQSLKLLATFRPVPLFAVMARNGFEHSEREIPDGDWEVVFTPRVGASPAASLPENAPAAPPARARQPASSAEPGEADDSQWPTACQSLDNRGLEPPEPLVRTLEAVEGIAVGDVLEIWNDRDPLFLYPELTARGHLAHREARGAEGYRVLIRKGVSPQEAA